MQAANVKARLRICTGSSTHSLLNTAIHGRIQRGTGGTVPPILYHKNRGFLSTPVKLQRLQASIQCWATIGPPANVIYMAFRWRVDDGTLIMVFGSSLSPNQLKKRKEVLKYQCCIFIFAHSKIVSEYDQEIPQSQTADKPKSGPFVIILLLLCMYKVALLPERITDKTNYSLHSQKTTIMHVMLPLLLV